MSHRHIDKLEVVLKVVERCNLACSYCYYFEGGDQSYKEKPPVVSINTIERLADFLKAGVKEAEIPAVVIVFHGGEPMMLKPKIFDEICSILKLALGSICQLKFSMQTNGTHITSTWLNLLSKHRVHVGVSIDGMKREQDKYRRFHNGRSSFSIVAKNYKILQEAQLNHQEIVDTISVLSADNDYSHLLKELNYKLGIDHFCFLLPDCSHDGGIPNGHSARDYGKVLCDIFDFWVSHRGIYIREVESLLQRFQLVTTKDKDKDKDKGKGPTRALIEAREYIQAIVVRSDGEIQMDDTFIPASKWRNSTPKFKLGEISLIQYLNHPIFDEISKYYNDPPGACKGCAWLNICNGGDLENRYSESNGFDNPSVYCAGLKMFYRKVALFLRRNGYPREILHARLKQNRLAVYEFLK